MNNKSDLIAMLREEFNRWDHLLATLSADQITAQRRPDTLSVKDTVAHLWAWQQRSIARMKAALSDNEPEYPNWPKTLDPEVDDVTDINAWIFETNKDKPWPNVYSDWREGFLRFLELAEAVPETDLLTPGRFAWLDGAPLAAVLQGSYEHHHIDHLEPLRQDIRGAS